MKNIKGFTLVEIIVSLVLISLVSGILVTLTLTKNKNREEKIKEVTLQIKEAAGVYLAINREINGYIEQNIYNGGSGYLIPLKTLLDEGYIGNSHIKTLEDNGVKININKDYMLAGVFSDTNYCDNTESTITIEASYELEKDTNYYLCNFTTEKKYVFYDLDGGKINTEKVYIINKGFPHVVTNAVPIKNQDGEYSYTFDHWSDKEDCSGNISSGTSLNINENKIIYACYNKNRVEKKLSLNDMKANAKFSNNIGKTAVSQEWCDTHPSVDKTNIVCNENGLFIDRDKSSGITYYYFRGAVENNYVKLAGKLWRIMWINSENKAKLILEDSVKIKVENLDGDSIYVDSDDTISVINIADIQNRPQDTTHIDRSKKINRKYTILNKNDQTQKIYGLLSDCSVSGVDCKTNNGKDYAFGVSYIYQNLDKYNYLKPYSFNFTNSNILNYSLYSNAISEFSNLLSKDQVFNEIVPDNLDWYYYSTDYNDEKSIYYKKYGCDCYTNSTCCYNTNFTTSYEIDQNSYNKTKYITGKIGLINYHELRMAGISTTLTTNSDNYLLKNNTSNFLIAEYGKEHRNSEEEGTAERKFGDRWYYVDGNDGNISDYQIRKYLEEKLPNMLLRTYDQHKNLDSCYQTSTVSGVKKCVGSNNSDGSLMLGTHTNDYFSLYSFKANTIRPVIEINLNVYKLSDSEGTKIKPYSLVK